MPKRFINIILGNLAVPKIIAANWKMNKTVAETEEFLRSFRKHSIPKTREVILCPPFTALAAASKLLDGTKIKLGSQNMHHEERGAFTGEVSARMLCELGVQYVLLGHSERRQLFHESDETVNKKMLAAVKARLIPILCVGETLSQRERNETEKIVLTQLKKCLSAVETDMLLVAYEPIWAIGTGKNATTKQAMEVHRIIRNYLRKTYRDVSILYGGSVTPENAKELLNAENIDGALVGGASLDAASFARIMAL